MWEITSESSHQRDLRDARISPNDPNAHPVHKYGTIITDENHPRNPRHRTIEQEFGQSYRAIAQYESWLTALLATCRVLVVDERTAGLYAEIRYGLKRTGQPIPENDIWIAALARLQQFPARPPRPTF